MLKSSFSVKKGVIGLATVSTIVAGTSIYQNLTNKKQLNLEKDLVLAAKKYVENKEISDGKKIVLDVPLLIENETLENSDEAQKCLNSYVEVTGKEDGNQYDPKLVCNDMKTSAAQAGETLGISVANIARGIVNPVINYEEPIYSTKALTNENVIVQIKFYEAVTIVSGGEGWSISADGMLLTKSYGSQMIDKVTVRAVNGVKPDATITINELPIIDKVFNKPVVSYDITTPTTGNVIATITADEPMQKIEGWTLSENKLTMTKEYTENKKEAIIVYDLAGNRQYPAVNVQNIDRSFEKPTVSYDKTTSTNGSVTATITAKEAMQEVEGWTLSEDKLSMTKVYADNAAEEVTVKDLAGNTETVQISIQNIDKVFNQPTVSYSTTALTNGNVTATITADEAMQEVEGWTLSTDKLSMTKEYEESTTSEVVVKDVAGNEQTVQINIQNIDKVFNKPTVAYNPTVPTTGNVTAIITADEAMQEVTGWVLSTDKLTMTKEYTDNAKEDVTVKDIAGNEQTVKVSITNVDRKFEKPTVSYDETEATNGNVIATIKAKEAMQAVEGWTLSEDKLSMTKEYEANASEEVLVKDLAGNTETVQVSIQNIDKVFNKPTVGYSTKDLTNGAVIVTITADEAMQAVTGWTLSTDKLTMTKEYSKNTTVDVKVKDLVGNVQTVTVNIKNIDKEFEKPTVSYSTKALTNGSVIVTISAEEPMGEVEGWTLSDDLLSMTKEYTDSITEEVVTKDIAGNEQIVQIDIKNIDKVFNQPTVSYSTTDSTRDNIVATITADEAMQEVEGWTLSKDKLSMTKEYTDNDSEEVAVKDIAGNIVTVQVSIANIDRIFNKPTVNYSTTALTNAAIEVTITADEAMQEVEGWTLSKDKLSMTKEFAKNTTEDVTVKDLVGNEQVVTINIKNIDEVFNAPKISYSETNPTMGNVVATITADEPMQEVEGWILSDDLLSMTKEYTDNVKGETVQVYDLAGNRKTAVITIKNIDREFEVPKVSYSETEATRGPVTATITSKEAMQAVEGWTLSEDKKSMTKEYADNAAEEVIVKDLAGNTQTVQVSITNIDIVFNKPVVSYDVVTLTNGNVIATITADEAMQETKGWTLSDNKLTMTKEFTKNTTVDVTVKDLVGNEQVVTINIKNIDKDFESPVVSYDITEPTNGNVTATITSEEPMQEVEGWTLSDDLLSMSKVYADNVEEESVTVKDIAGNEKTVKITIQNIDKKFELPTVSYDVTKPTTGNVFATITAKEAMQAVEGWTLSEDKLSMTKEYADNVTEEVSVKDLVGNVQTVQVSIANIDRVFVAPTVSYDVTTPTKGKVVATITSTEAMQATEGWTLSEDKLTMTKEYADNAAEEVTVKDLAGNTATVQVNIANIDKAFNKPVVSFNPEVPTMGNVVATITADEAMQAVEGWTLSDDGLIMTKEFTDNDTVEVTVKDLAGNEQTVEVAVTNIDRKFDAPTVSYDETEATRGPVTATITSKEAMQAVEGWTLSEDKKSMTKEYADNASEEVIVKDLAGNEQTVQVSITNIDIVFNKPVVSYDVVTLTNGNVIATITADEAMQETKGWTLSDNKLTMTKEFTKNTTVDVTVKDLVGNVQTVTISIKNIDKDFTEPKVSYSTTEPTNGDVTAIITAEEPMQEVEGWTLSDDLLSMSKVYADNVEEESVTVKDIAGNEKTVKITIQNIDKKFELPTVSYDVTKPTTGNVVATITAKEAMQVVEGWILSDDKLTMTKEYADNVTEEVSVKDLVGNVQSVQVSITNIDRMFVAPTVSYDVTTPTKGKVVATITSTEAMQAVEGWTLSDDKLTMTKEFTDNDTVEVTVKDLAGNTQTVQVSITNIDKAFNKPVVSFNPEVPTMGNVVATITADEAMQEVEGWTLSDDGVIMTKEFTDNDTVEVTIKDLAGNEQTVEVAVTNIDREFVAPTVSYDETEATRGPVTATITSKEAMQVVEGWTLSEDKKSMTKEFNDNIDLSVLVKDIAGNEQTVQVSIANIDIVFNKPAVSYDVTTLTNGNVIATITADEAMQETKGWTLSDNKLTMTKEFTKNTTVDVTVKDLVGNEQVVTINIKNIDKDFAAPVVSYDITEPTNGNVTATIASEEPMQEVEGWTLSDDLLSMSKVYADNVEEESVTVKDIAGNEKTVKITIQNIDKKFELPTISYDVTKPTTGNVFATITAKEAMQAVEGWTLSEDKLSMTKEYTDNVAEEVAVKDLVGNVQTVQVSIANIDRVFVAPTVSYDVTTPTKGKVVATITSKEAMQAVEGWTLSEDKLSMTKEYADNAAEEVTVKDLAGNTATVQVNIANIDKAFNKPTVSFNPEVPTMGNVVATITADEKMQAVEGWTLSDDGLIMTKEFTDNDTVEVTVTDLAGNTQKVEVAVTNIDREFVAPTVSYDETEATRGPVTATITSKEAMQALEGWTLSDDLLTMTKEFNDNIDLSVLVKDIAGNEQTVQVSITNIDIVFNKPVVSYDVVTLTNGNVIATITADEAMQAVKGWTLSDNKLIMTKEFTKNTTVDVTVKDLVGNEQVVTINIKNIDKDFTEPKVTYSTEELTNGNVTAFITADEPMQAVEGWTLSDDLLTMTKEYADNVEESVTVKDIAGNEKTVKIAIENIDKAFELPTVSFNPSEPTMGNVVATITADEAMQVVEGWTLSEDKLSMTKEFTDNDTVEVTVKDLAGNTVTVQVAVTNIDRVFNKPTVGYSTTALTNVAIEVTITADEAMQAVEGWTLSEDKLSMTKEYDDNVELDQVVVKDLVGNEQTVEISIKNIDREFNKPTVNYSTTEPTNGNVTAIITADKAMQATEGWTLSEDKLSMTKEYTDNVKSEIVQVYDLAGNRQTVVINVKNIDREFELPEVSYDVTKPTTGNVIATITAKEAMQVVEGWTLSEDKLSMTKEYDDNTAEEVIVKDLAGNVGTVQISIVNIDREFTLPVVSYDVTVPTKGKVVATITSTEAMQETEGWTLSEDKLSMTKEYADNVTEEVTVKDLAGNTATVQVSIANIDKAFNKPVVSFNPEVPTMGNVVATITADEAMQVVEGWTLSEDKLSMSKEFTDNDTVEVTTKDLAGNEQTVEVAVTNIDREFVAPTVSYDETEATRGPVTATITSKEAMQVVEGWTLSEDKKSMTKEYADNVTEEVIVKDLAGNTQTVQVSITNIDIVFNKPVVSYDVVTLTNGNVIATITSDEAMQAVKGWTLSDNKLIMTKEFTKNTTVDVTVKDLVGNEQVVTIDIKNIDKDFESPVVSYDITEPTNGNVTAIITSEEPMQGVEGWTLSDDLLSMSKVYGDNVEEESVTVKDIAGNEKTVKVTIQNIDKTFEVPTISYDVTKPTIGNVFATITAKEAMQAVEGWTLSEDKLSMTKEYTDNVAEEVVVKDLVGNVQSVQVSIANIDRLFVTPTVSYDVTVPTKGKVVATITSTEAMQVVEGWTLSEDKLTMTKEYADNAAEEVTVKDLAGNTATVQVNIANIDKAFNKPVVSFNPEVPTMGNVVATITADEAIGEIEGWILSEDKLSMSKEFADNDTVEVTVKDLAGNEQTVEVAVTNIDREFVAPKVSYDETEATRGPVTVTITSKEAMQATEGWTLSEDKKSMTKEYADNVTEEVIVKDLAGNTQTVQVSITNIDKIFELPVVSYDVTVPTKGKVVATITAQEAMQATEGWTLSKDKLSMTKEYTDNVELEQVVVKDLVGNEQTVQVSIANIDKVFEVPTVTYNVTVPTIGNVIATITSTEAMQATEGWTLSDDKLTMTKEYTDNVSEEVAVKDLAGNEQTVAIKIENIDREFELPTISYNVTEPTMGNVVATITAKEAMQALEGWTLSEDKLSMTKEYTDNVAEEVVVKDLVGNVQSVQVSIANIDRLFVTPTVSYDVTVPTKGKVVATITSTEAMQETEGWTLSKDKLSMTKEYTDSITEEVTVKDLAGNTATVQVSITNIDKAFNKPVVSFNPEVPTMGNVVATITADEAMLEVEGWILSEDKLSMSKEFTDNDTVEVTVKDLAGNEQTVEVAVTNIDREFKAPKVSYDKTEATAGPVIATITSKEKMQVTEGWTLSEDQLTMTKSYAANVLEEVIVKDLAGNAATVQVNIINIDIVFNKPTVSYDVTTPTKGRVTVTITADEPMQEVEGFKLSEDKLSMTKEYSDNTSEVVTVKDIVGNEQSVQINISNIDKEFAAPVVTYNVVEPTIGNVIATITADEPMQEVEGFTLSEDKLSMTREYTDNAKEAVTVKDIAGNEQVVIVEIKNIDRQFEKPTVTYNVTEPTMGNVIVTITAKEAMQVTEGWTLSQDKLSMTKEYADNVTEEVTVKDLVGNTKTVQVSITNIDREFVLPTVTYDVTEATSGNVTATITALEPMQEVEGFTLSEDKLSMTKEFEENVTTGVIVKDLVGNEQTVVINIQNIDKEFVLPTVSYSNTNSTKEPVTVTISALEAMKELKGWTLSEDKLSMTKQFTENTTQNVTVSDLLGNEQTVEVKITNIDTTAPSVGYKVSNKPNKNNWFIDPIMVTISGEDKETSIVRYEYQVFVNNTLVTDWTATESLETPQFTIAHNSNNIQFKVRSFDEAGNVSEETVSETYALDSVKPSVNSAIVTTPGNTGWYLQDIQVSINGSDELSGITNLLYAISTDNGETWSDWTNKAVKNGTTEFKIESESSAILYRVAAMDAAGNMAEAVTSSVLKMDKTAPTIQVANGDTVSEKDFKVELEASREGTYTVPSATVKDNLDTNVQVVASGEVNIAKVGNYPIVYTSTDAAGNTKTITLTVVVKDTTAPTITLNGEKEVSILYGSSYTELGANALDNLDETVKLNISGTVNPYKVGAYKITYTATDASGNKKTVERIVNVVATTTTDLFRQENGCESTGDCYNTQEQDNYVWYSGHLWRVIKVNENNTIKLITEDAVAGFSYDDDSSTFKGSHAEKWLNSEFYSSLNSASKLIVQGDYCSDLSIKIPTVRYTCQNVVKSNVGLLTIDEYNILGGLDGFLNNGERFFTMTPTTAKSNWVIHEDGYAERGHKIEEPYAMRPVITMKSLNIVSGKGTFADPYRISNDASGAANTMLNKRVSGEYVTFAGKTWRIVKATGTATRLIYDSYYMEGNGYARVPFGTYGTFSTTEGVGQYLNTTVYNTLFSQKEKDAMLLTKWYYNSYGIGKNPYNTTLSASTKSTMAYVGLPRVGELMSVVSATGRVDQFTAWTLNSDGDYSGYVWYTSHGGTSDMAKVEGRTRGIRPVIELNPSVKIKSGNGTYASPYTLEY